MRVLLDVSKLGANYKPGGYTTGIGRVIESLATEFLDIPECELTLSSIRFHSQTQAFLRDHKQLQRARLAPQPQPIPLSVSQRIVRRSHFVADKLASSLPAPLCWPPRALRYGISGLDQKTRNGIKVVDESTLSAAQIFHSTLDPLPEQTRDRCQRFLTVYDLIPLRYPQFFQVENSAGVQRFFTRIVQSLTSEDHVICPSEATRNDFCEFSGHDAQRVHIIPLAAERQLFYPCEDRTAVDAVREKYSLPEGQYILSVCKIEPRKNLKYLLEAFADLLRTEKIRDLYLVLAGTQAWDFDTLQEIAENLEPAWLRERVLFPGHVEEDDLAALYSGAMVFVCVSLAEGFGLPLLEAMQCGTPVIAANVTSLPEVVGDAGMLISPHRRDELSQSLLKIYNSSTLRTELSYKSLMRAMRFSWQNCAQETMNAYAKALNQ